MSGSQTYEAGQLACGNQASDLFELLIRYKIVGLPMHITRMSIHLSINPNLPPYVDVERALSDEDGNLVFAENRFNDEMIIKAERYRLIVAEGIIQAKKEPHEVHSYTGS